MDDTPSPRVGPLITLMSTWHEYYVMYIVYTVSRAVHHLAYLFLSSWGTIGVRNSPSRASKCICHLSRTPSVWFVSLWYLLPGGVSLWRHVTHGDSRHFALIGSWITDSEEDPALFGYINHWPKVKNFNHCFTFVAFSIVSC